MPNKTYIACLYPIIFEGDPKAIPYPHKLILDDTHLTATSLPPRSTIRFSWRIQDILAVTEDPQNPLILKIHACPLGEDGRRRYDIAHLDDRFLSQFIFPTMSEDGKKLDDMDTFKHTIDKLIRPHSTPPSQSHIHVFINPNSGAKLAQKHWSTIVQPILVNGGINNFSLTVTTARGHAEEEAKKIDHSHVYLVVVGGDGTVHEALNGLLSRSSPPSKIHLGVVPSGTGNAIATSMGVLSVEDAAFRIAKGHTKRLNIMQTQLGVPSPSCSNKLQWEPQLKRCAVIVSYGFHTQVVSKSEWGRMFGNARFKWAALLLSLTLAQYPIKLIMGGKEVRLFDKAKGEFIRVKEHPVELNDNFTYFVGVKQSTLEPGFCVAPLADSSDSFIDLMFMRNASRKDLSDMGAGATRAGLHVKDVEKVEYYKCQEMELHLQEPGIVCLDGEIVSVPGGGGIKVEVIDENTIEIFV